MFSSSKDWFGLYFSFVWLVIKFAQIVRGFYIRHKTWVQIEENTEGSQTSHITDCRVLCLLILSGFSDWQRCWASSQQAVYPLTDLGRELISHRLSEHRASPAPLVDAHRSSRQPEYPSSENSSVAVLCVISCMCLCVCVCVCVCCSVSGIVPPKRVMTPSHRRLKGMHQTKKERMRERGKQRMFWTPPQVSLVWNSLHKLCCDYAKKKI